MPIVSIMLFIFGGALLIYALIARITKRITVPANRRASVQNITKAYAVKLAKLIAFLAIAPIAGGIVGLLTEITWIPVAVFGALFIALLIIGIKTIMKEEKEPEGQGGADRA